MQNSDENDFSKNWYGNTEENNFNKTYKSEKEFVRKSVCYLTNESLKGIVKICMYVVYTDVHICRYVNCDLSK